MEGVEGMNSIQAAFTKELDCDTVGATIHAFLAAEFAMVISGHSPTFKSDELLQENFTFLPPQQERIVLAAVSLKIQQ
jgi:hypothetical protein